MKIQSFQNANNNYRVDAKRRIIFTCIPRIPVLHMSNILGKISLFVRQRMSEVSGPFNFTHHSRFIAYDGRVNASTER